MLHIYPFPVVFFSFVYYVCIKLVKFLKKKHSLTTTGPTNINKNSLFVAYLTTLSVSRLYGDDDRMINEYGAVGGMKIGRGNRITRRKQAPVPLSPA
jgi:hypothetical protein